MKRFLTSAWATGWLLALLAGMPVGADDSATLRLGYTELRTNLPGGRHANVRTMRAAAVDETGRQHRRLADELIDGPDSWTQFAGWSPDGRQAIVNLGWQDPENAQWEEQHQSFRMAPGKWRLDCCLVNPTTGASVNLTAIERVSHYNAGLFFKPGGRGLGFTALIEGVSKPFAMDLDGRNKKDVSGDGRGFAYGYSASPDGEWISYHEDYQLYLARPDGADRRRIETGNPFNFAPRWSPDGQWLLFVSGEHLRSNPYVVRWDGSELRKIADLGGYQGTIQFLDVPDFHQGSSDLPEWSADGRSVFFTARAGENVELFQTTLDGKVTQWTHGPPGALHYHPLPLPDGRRVVYGSLRDQVRQLYMLDLASGAETRLTALSPGQAAMWPYWRPLAGDASTQPIAP